jgi:hypothetical protein
MRSFLIRFVCLAAVALMPAAPAGATTMVKRMELAELAGEAVRIVHGTVTDVQSGRDTAGKPATWVTIAVTRTVKGDVGKTLTIKQWGVTEPLADGGIRRIAGMPRYTVGEEVVLFLRADSASGFTSPVGLDQGVYRVKDGVTRSAGPQKPEPVGQFLDKVGRLGGWGQ